LDKYVGLDVNKLIPRQEKIPGKSINYNSLVKQLEDNTKKLAADGRARSDDAAYAFNATLKGALDRIKGQNAKGLSRFMEGKGGEKSFADILWNAMNDEGKPASQPKSAILKNKELIIDPVKSYSKANKEAIHGEQKKIAEQDAKDALANIGKKTETAQGENVTGLGLRIKQGSNATETEKITDLTKMDQIMKGARAAEVEGRPITPREAASDAKSLVLYAIKQYNDNLGKGQPKMSIKGLGDYFDSTIKRFNPVTSKPAIAAETVKSAISQMAARGTKNDIANYLAKRVEEESGSINKAIKNRPK
jgi:hypothetical protein